MANLKINQLTELNETPASADKLPIWDESVESTKYVSISNLMGDLVDLNTEQTITNKTLTSPVITTPTGIVAGDVGLGNVDNTSDATKNSATATLTNKRITKRVTSEASSATPAIDTDNTDIHRITALAVNITSFTTNLTGTPTHGQNLIVEITGTDTRTIDWGASFEASTVALPTTTDSTNMLTVGFSYNSATSKWRCVAVA
jgi:hypothetical protein